MEKVKCDDKVNPADVVIYLPTGAVVTADTLDALQCVFKKMFYSYSFFSSVECCFNVFPA